MSAPAIGALVPIIGTPVLVIGELAPVIGKRALTIGTNLPVIGGVAPVIGVVALVIETVAAAIAGLVLTIEALARTVDALAPATVAVVSAIEALVLFIGAILLRIIMRNSRKNNAQMQTNVHILLKKMQGLCTVEHGISRTLCTMVHIGSKIKEVQQASGLSVTAFAKKIHTSRRNVYMLFERASIDTAMLVRISQVLGHDFFRYYTIAGTSAEQPAPEEDDRFTRLENEMAALREAIDRLGEKSGKDNGVAAGK